MESGPASIHDGLAFSRMLWFGLPVDAVGQTGKTWQDHFSMTEVVRIPKTDASR